MSDSLYRVPPTNAELFGAAWMQDSGIVRAGEDAVQRFRQWGSAFAPPAEPGYNVFQDEALRPFLLENPGAMHMFRASRSRAESEHVRDRVLRLREREETLNLGGAFWSRMAASMVSPEAVATAPLGIGAIGGGASRLGAAASAGGRMAALNMGTTALELAAGASSIPTDIAPEWGPELALSGLFGGVLGGLAGGLSHSALRRAAQEHAAAHDRHDGLRTPGVERATEPEAAADPSTATPNPTRIIHDPIPATAADPTPVDGPHSTFAQEQKSNGNPREAGGAADGASTEPPAVSPGNKVGVDGADPPPAAAAATAEREKTPSTIAVAEAEPPPGTAPAREGWFRITDPVMQKEYGHLLPGLDEIAARLMPDARIEWRRIHPDDDAMVGSITDQWYDQSGGRGPIGGRRPRGAGDDEPDLMLRLEPGMDPQEALRVAFHEMGHGYHYRRLGEAPMEVQEAIVAEWKLERGAPDSAVLRTRFELENALRRRDPFEAGRIVEPGFRPDAEDIAYSNQFEEWFAERFAQWLHSREAPRSALERFFAQALEAMRTAWQRAMKALGLDERDYTGGAFERLLDAEWARTAPPPETLAAAARLDAEFSGLTDVAGSATAGMPAGGLRQPSGSPPGPPSGGAASAPAAAPVPPGSQRLQEGAQWIRWRQLPWYVLKNNRFESDFGELLAGDASMLAKDPLRMAGTSDTASVEALRDVMAVRYADAQRAQDAAYYEHMGWDPQSAGDVSVAATRLKQRVREGLGREAVPAGRMGLSEFDQAVGRAIDGDPHADPAVNKAAERWREMYRGMEREAAERGVILSGRYKAEGEAAMRVQSDGHQAEADRLVVDLDKKAGVTRQERRAADAAKDRIRKAEELLAKANTAADEARADWEAAGRPSGPGLPAADQAVADAYFKAAEAVTRSKGGVAASKQPLEAVKAKLAALADPLDQRRVALLAAHEQAIDGLGARRQALKDMPVPAADDFYRPRVWLRDKVARDADRDALVDRIGPHFETQRAAEEAAGEQAPGRVRGEAAIARVAGDDTVEQLVRAATRFLRDDQGLTPAIARERALKLAAPARQLFEAAQPDRLGVEIRSALAQRGDKAPVPGLRKAMAETLRAAGLGKDASERLALAIAGADDAAAFDIATPGHAKQRDIDIPNKLVLDWLDNSQTHHANDYVRRIGASIELSRRSGDASMLLHRLRREAQGLDEIGRGNGSLAGLDGALGAQGELRDKVLGVFRIPEDPSALSVRSLRFVKNTSVMAQMGGTIFTALSEPAMLVLAYGMRATVGGAMDLALHDRAGFRLAAAEAERAGIGLDVVNLQNRWEVEEATQLGGRSMGRVERLAEEGARGLQLANLMGPWTKQLSRFAGAMAQDEMVRLSVGSRAGTLDAADAGRLAAYGISPERAARYAEAWEAAGAQKIGGGKFHLAGTESWPEALQRDFRAQLNSAVDRVALRPGAATMPNFMSAPLFQTLLLYKSFAMVATQRLLLAGAQQRDARALSAVLAAVSLAWIVEQARNGWGEPQDSLVNWDRVRGEDTKAAREDGWLRGGGSVFTAIEKSGVLGLLGDVNQSLETLSGQSLGARPLLGLEPPAYLRDPHWGQRAGVVAGAAASPWLNAAWALTSPEAKGNQVAGAIRRTVPLNNLWLWNGAVGALAREAGGAIGDPDD